MKYLRSFSLAMLLLSSATGLLPGQQHIDEARGMPLGDTVSINGIVTSGPELGTIRYMQDTTGGLAVYSSKMSAVQRGDSVSVTGVLKAYVTLLELDPVLSVTVHSNGHELPEPLILTPGQFTESYEGMLVRVEDAVIPVTGKFQRKSYDFLAGGQEGQLYINSTGSPLIGIPIPEYPVSITGPLGSYNGTYQLLPRDTNDLVLSNTIHLTGKPFVAGLTTEGLSIGWSTDQAGSTEAFYGNTPALEQHASGEPEDTTGHLLEFSGMEPSQLIYIQPFSVKGADTARAVAGIYMTRSASGGEMRTLFNQSVDPGVSLGILEAEQLVNGLDEVLIAYIDQAGETIDMCIYNLNNQGISNISAALNDAHQRGVVVRVIYDRDRDPAGIGDLDPDIGKLASPPEDYPYFGIMHNKFVVLDALSADPDRPLVWTGSTNLAYSQINNDPNNVIVVQDQSLAKAYRMEFNEMFGSEGAQPDSLSAKFGPEKTDNTPHEFVIGGKRVECYFSPSDKTNRHILEAIESAGQSVHVATMLITRTDLGESLAERGTGTGQVRILLNGYDANGEAVVNLLKGASGVDLRLKGEPGIMHHKYVIIDQEDAGSDPLLLTGSHNWSASAEDRNDENTLIIHDQGVANAYYQEFVERFAAGIPQTDPDNLEEAMEEGSPSWRIYPNTVQDQVHLHRDRGSGMVRMVWVDSGGKAVLHEGPEYLRAGESLVIQVDHLQPGLYLLRIIPGDGAPASFRIFIQ